MTTPDAADGHEALYVSRSLFPDPPTAAIKHSIGQRLADLQAPAAVIDVAVVRRNCRLMLETMQKLGIGFRAHVKTHKTTQLARLQVGEGSKDIRVIVSTVAEVESLMPWLTQSKEQGKAVSVLYGLPVSASAVPRLAAIARKLGQGSIGVLVDHPDQIKFLDSDEMAKRWPNQTVPAFVKIDVGYHRAGIASNTTQMTAVAQALASTEHVQLAGFYAHMGQSYAVNSTHEAIDHLITELHGLEDAAQAFFSCVNGGQSSFRTDGQVVLTLGASPTATAAQNLLDNSDRAMAFRSSLEKIKQAFAVEIHAGVYPLLDMQQLATRARPSTSTSGDSEALLSFASLGLRILVEVASVYDDRDGESEALIAAGSVVLGREPCKSYPGWGVVAPWPNADAQYYNPEEGRTGWIVDKISQEHGILRWHGAKSSFWPVRYGQKLLLFPNHACMAAPNFSFYVIVDSEGDDPDLVVDVWTRCRGW